MWECELIRLIQITVQCLALVPTVIRTPVLHETWNSLTSCVSIDLSRRDTLHGVIYIAFERKL
jgi:hypothetical protein